MHHPPGSAQSTLSVVAAPAEGGSDSSIAVPVDVEAPAAARRHIGRALHANGVGDGVLAVVELLVSEVVTNVIRHEDSQMVDIDVAVEADHAVTVTVTGGVATPTMALIHPVGVPELSSQSGRGLTILDSLAYAWGTRRQDRRTAVWFTVRDTDAAGHPNGHGSDTQAASDAVVAEALAITSASEADLNAVPEVVAVQAAFTAEQAAIDAAAMTAEAAQTARVARAVAATLAANAVAEEAARTVEAVQFQADELAAAVAAAASDAAATVANSIMPGGYDEAARAAVRVGATVTSAAVAKAEETARAAVLVARAVAAAAAAVAATTAAAAAAMEDEVLDAAVAVRAVTAATAQQLAADTVVRGAALALTTREAATASERLHEANRQLLQAGRHDRSVALALQSAMLTHLPESDDLQLAARYLTAAEQDQVGGDWYDAVVLPNGSTTLVIGDVIGHDIAAAAVMGQLRNLLRALVWDRDEPPSAIVGRLDRAVRDLHISTMATLILVSLEPRLPGQPAGDSTVRWTNAGHPAPILVQPDGTAIALEAPTDYMLGVDPETARRDHTHQIPAGSTLLLYTDGLIEVRGQSITTGQQRLLDAVRTHHRLDPGELLDAVLADMVGNRPGDDVAVLAVRFQKTT